MRIGLVSDTHLPRFGRQLPAPLVHGLTEAGVSLILHAGDLTAPEVAAWFEAIAPFDAVAGNNDPPELWARYGRCKVLTVAGVRIGMVHGDGTGGSTRERAIAAFADAPVDVVLYGHSHIPYCERHGTLWVVNPGSPSDKRRQPRYSYGLLEIVNGVATPWLVYYERK